MSRFAVIDTETTWGDEVMSIGTVIAESDGFKPVDSRYYVLTPFKEKGGMFTYALYAEGIKPDIEGLRESVMEDLTGFLAKHKVSAMFAYNAAFDYRHLPELHYLAWFDIMKLAAYRQHNPKIPKSARCFGTGRLKRGYGVESIYRMLSGDFGYSETHNALFDAADELKIMRLLNIDIDDYYSAKIS